MHLKPGDLHTLSAPQIPGVEPEAVLGICGKLQSLGLIATPQQHSSALRKGSYPTGGGFVLLERSQMFLRFVLK